MIVTRDERFAPRYEVELPVELLAAGAGAPIPARSVNLGAGGLCLEPGAGIADRTAVLCRLDTGGGSLEAQGEVAWQLDEDGAYRVGIRFSALTPAMAIWLASVSRTTSKVSVPSPSSPESDTQPMRVPVPPQTTLALGAEGRWGPRVAEEAEAPASASPATAMVAGAAMRPVPKAANQLSLPIGPPHPGAVGDGNPAGAGAEEVEVDVPDCRPTGDDSQVLFDDMPPPEVRMMRPPVPHAGVETVAASRESKAVESFSPWHRVAALTGRTGRRCLAVLAMCRAALGHLFGALRGRRGLRRPVASTTSRILAQVATIRVAGLVAALRKRSVQLAVAASAVVLLIGSGLYVLLSGPSSADQSPADGTETAQPDPNRSYWDPPVMPAPAEAPPDQEIVEVTARPGSSIPERATSPGRMLGGGPAVASATAGGIADEVPLPEPPAIAQPEPVAVGMAEPDPGSEPEPMGEPLVARADPQADGADRRMEPSSAPSRRADSPSRADGRDERHEGRADARSERRGSRADMRDERRARTEPRETRADARTGRHESRADARTGRHESRADARTERHESRADTRPERQAPAERHEGRANARSDVASRGGSAGPSSGAATSDLHASNGTAAGASDFRLNLSGTPGSIQHYPLANPNGIVIDVPELHHPGAATKLTSDDPRIRFVKILNRDSGVRFIVYVNGPLASYDVQASGRGLRVAIAAAN